MNKTHGVNKILKTKGHTIYMGFVHTQGISAGPCSLATGVGICIMVIVYTISLV